MLFYRAALPLSSRTLTYASGIIRRHRAAAGSRRRKLNPGKHALLVLVYLRKGERFAELAAGFGVGICARDSRNGVRTLRRPASSETSRLTFTQVKAQVRTTSSAPGHGDEAATLLGSLERQRATFAWKVSGLDEKGLAAKVGASTLTLGGLIKHLAFVET